MKIFGDKCLRAEKTRTFSKLRLGIWFLLLFTTNLNSALAEGNIGETIIALLKSRFYFIFFLNHCRMRLRTEFV